MKKGVFVCGTDTGVGKTIVTGLLGRFLKEKDRSVITQKWVQTGSSFPGSDILTHLKIMRRPLREVYDCLELISPYVFKFPASPHLAARYENKRINANKIITSFNSLSLRFDFVIVEGTGGVLVPLNGKTPIIDLVRKVGLPVLLIAQNKLGTINQTLLTIEAIEKRRIKVLGIILINIPGQEGLILRDNSKTIKDFSKVEALGVLPWSKNYDFLYRRFIPAGRRIEKMIR